MTQFPTSKMKQLQDDIKKALLEVKEPIAAFDADGTLWDTDLGENFLKFKIKNNLIPDMGPDWFDEFYLKKEAQDPSQAYLWLAQILKGQEYAKVQEWAKEAVESISPLPILESQKELIAFLKSEGVKVYIVTASVKWAVDPASHLVGLTPDDVLGVQTKIIDGKVTDQPGGEITWREGKIKGLLEATKGIPPFFAAGNTTGDMHLLEGASHLRLVVSAAKENLPLWQTEKNMLHHAQENSWFHHRY